MPFMCIYIYIHILILYPVRIIHKLLHIFSSRMCLVPEFYQCEFVGSVPWKKMPCFKGAGPAESIKKVYKLKTSNVVWVIESCWIRKSVQKNHGFFWMRKFAFGQAFRFWKKVYGADGPVTITGRFHRSPRKLPYGNFARDVG